MFANPGLPIPRKNRHVHPHRLRWLAAALLAAGAPMAHAIDASGDASGAQLNLNAQLLLVHATATAPPTPPRFPFGNRRLRTHFQNFHRCSSHLAGNPGAQHRHPGRQHGSPTRSSCGPLPRWRQ